MNVFLLCTDPPVADRLRTILDETGLAGDVTRCGDLANAVEAPARDFEIMVLGECSSEDRDAAEAVVDRDGLPRWAVFDLLPGQASEAAAIYLPLERDNAHLAEIITIGLENHRLRRMNLQMAGDFRSVSRRVCHDLRTPLSCIQTVLSVVEASGGAGALPDALMESASTSTQELARMIDELAMLGRTWGIPSEPVQVRVDETLDEARESIARRFPNRELRIERPASMPDAQGVLSWVEFIWETYLAFALERLDEGTGVAVNAHPPVDGCVRFTVVLPGLAAAAAEITRAFLPFHLLADQRGRGRVDFALVQRFARLMNGSYGCVEQGADLQLYFSLPQAGD